MRVRVSSAALVSAPRPAGCFVRPGKQSMGWLMTCLLGIAGSLVAGYVGQAMGGYTLGRPAGWLASTVGAMVLVFVYVKLRGATAKNPR